MTSTIADPASVSDDHAGDRAEDHRSGGHDARPEPRPHAAPAVPTAKPAAKAAKPDPKAERALVRKTVQTAVALAECPAERREMLATLLGARRNADTVTLVLALHDSDSASRLAPITALLAIANDDDDMEAGISAVEMAENQAKAKAVWSLLVSLKAKIGSTPLPNNMPPVVTKVGLNIAKAVRQLNDDQLGELNALRDLLR